jgi:hypothetical protein
MRIGLAGGAELYAQTMPLAYVRKLFFLQFSDPSHALFSVPPVVANWMEYAYIRIAID